MNLKLKLTASQLFLSTIITFVGGETIRGGHPNMDSLSRTLQQTCNLGEDFVECETTSRSCADYEIQGCSVSCIDGFACYGATIEDSSVFCPDVHSCKGTTIKDSSVECSKSFSCQVAQIWRSFVYCGDHAACSQTEFHASAMSCADTFQSCSFAEYKDQCTCCDGPGCGALQRCTVNGAPSEEFCASESAGITCAALGNPVCEGMPGYPQETEGTPEPTTCNLGEDFVECETTSRSCAGLAIQDCSVFCVDGNACYEATIEDSSVFCSNMRSCHDATIKDSSVECSDNSSCDGAQIWRSFVYCGDQGACSRTEFHASAMSCADTFQSCSFAEYTDQCTCCDGPRCPTVLQRCTVNGAPSEEFCASESAGITCTALGNPVCEGMPGYPQETEGTPEPTAPEPTTSEPTTPEPSTSVPTPPLETLEPTTPTTPEPTTPEPITTAPPVKTPEPTQAPSGSSSISGVLLGALLATLGSALL